ncbi:SDR family NAD(P)-dependent oxidoreductase [Campylobacter sp. 19-13652]|uniref:SDR family NAD(P)-dependent oxidoreductase n=1 Tax=Campylobacter sp. 19-13652 TaxID=2840180 RepID=UPI001C78F471|nr:SDR family NAD(P)-dependent oxidoreductase [Campylobacter sp. 19-13652]BCX79379.1 oxidoreductase [Campylobacter sp. 19-13652]
MKTAFVTGASSGFGQASARALCKNGYVVAAMARRGERLRALKDELGENLICLECDVRDKDALNRAIGGLDERFKSLDVLVNNAGLALGQERFSEASIDDFDVMIDTNIKGLVYVTKALLPAIIKARGYIFNLGSVAGVHPYPGANVYGGTKAFVRQLSLNLRNDLTGTGVRVTNIAPGIAKTEFSQVRFKGDEAKSSAVYERTKYLSAEDIARIITDCLALPEHVNINELEVMATTQTWAGFAIERE